MFALWKMRICQKGRGSTTIALYQVGICPLRKKSTMFLNWSRMNLPDKCMSKFCQTVHTQMDTSVNTHSVVAARNNQNCIAARHTLSPIFGLPYYCHGYFLFQTRNTQMGKDA